MKSFTVREAAAEFGVSRGTIHNYLKNGKVHGIQGENGTWSIPLDSLLAAGFVFHDKHVNIDDKHVKEHVKHDNESEIALLRLENNYLKKIVDKLEKNNDDLRFNLKMIEARPPVNLPVNDHDNTIYNPVKNENSHKTGWWSRRKVVQPKC